MPTGFLSPWHIIIFLLVVLLVFGPRRIPEAGRALGKGMREFKHSLTSHHMEDEAPTSPTRPAAAGNGPVARRDQDLV